MLQVIKKEKELTRYNQPTTECRCSDLRLSLPGRGEEYDVYTCNGCGRLILIAPGVINEEVGVYTQPAIEEFN